ncbi:hypothetical protein E0Z10_g2898 [Xylaria hypoxylon]|uniref:Vacuolar transporter chaperone complex subunit 4 n=1 Tax=Xylaria hypoxylon TaxID=37992 RepID=A0A4Z0Z3B2_9PEZI|nr:hypothetical protein E0Z10_g2898 [Xylaria hypoxylon]
MKFGQQLRSSIIREYQWYYIDYNALKAELKRGSGSPDVIHEDDNQAGPSDTRAAENTRRAHHKKKWTEEDEQAFIAKLYAELEKVYTKTKVKQSEIQRRIAVGEREVREVVSRATERGLNEQGPSEEEFILLEEDLSDIIADVHDLAKYVQLNYTGFYKIIKKHDKTTNWYLRPAFDTALKKKPFYNEDFDAEVVKLSNMYNNVRTRGNPVKGDSAAGGSQGSFVRQTTKYWVHPDNVTELKLVILKHLPVLVFNASKEFEIADSAITSIYYDNTDKWNLYEGRLKKTEGAEAIRLRWYGGMQNDTIFVERKTHREDWTGEKSVKARFSMKEKNVNAYMRGDLLTTALFEKARKDGKKSEKAIAEDESLAKEIQYSVLKNGYRPVCRSFYNRTAFQLPADARVRISLDTELTMVREDNLDGVRRSGDNWRRMDIGIDWPFSQLPAGDLVRFPYAVLEVKLQTQHGQEPPEWVRQLISSHLVEAVPKFSKFIHGTASMFPDHINLLPYWMPQMDIDIRKPVTHNFGIQRPDHSLSGTTSDEEEDDSDDDETLEMTAESPSNGNNGVSRNAQTLVPGDIEGQTTSGPIPNVDYPLYDSDDDSDEEDRIEEARRLDVELYSNRNQMFFGNQEIQNRKFKAPKGKKIYVPVRVEPKVYFAAERTFLGWLEFSIYVGAIAATLLNFGEKPSILAFLAAGFFTLLGVLALCYSVGIYLYRSQGIRERRVIKYYDRIGPSVLCGALFIGVILNFAFEGYDRNLW